jgi:hypothetical protein|tara:strand:+ start:1095 stop:1757 length:663 start_codon:yes stop_codon:yes gene_type:complete
MNNPFNKAWLVLKRQTALSEFEGFEELEDLPMPNQRQKITVPTHINRMMSDEGGRDYVLMSGNTELGHIHNEYEGSQPDKRIESFGGYIYPDYRRQSLYQKLLNALIQNNYKIISDHRNELSHSAHKKFQENLPANVKFSEPLKELDILPFERVFSYEKQPTEMIGGMQRYDYGGLPIRNVENPEMVEYESKPMHQRMKPKFSDPNNPYRQFMRLDEFSE